VTEGDRVELEEQTYIEWRVLRVGIEFGSKYLSRSCKKFNQDFINNQAFIFQESIIKINSL
jgi:hypothetical protein